MPLLLLRGQWPGQFHRVIRNEQGEAIRTVEFSKDEPVEVSEEELELFRDDIGPALWLVEPNGSGGWTILDDGKRLQDITPGRIEYLREGEEITFSTPSKQPVPLAAGNAVKEPPETSVTSDQEKVDPTTVSTDPPATETAADAKSEQTETAAEEVPAPKGQTSSTDAATTVDTAEEQPPAVVPPKKNVDDF